MAQHSGLPLVGHVQLKDKAVGRPIAEGVDDLYQSWMLQFGHYLDLTLHVLSLLLLRASHEFGRILGLVFCVSRQVNCPEFTAACVGGSVVERRKIKTIQTLCEVDEGDNNKLISTTDRPSSTSVISYKSFGFWSTRSFTSRLWKFVTVGSVVDTERQLVQRDGNGSWERVRGQRLISKVAHESNNSSSIAVRASKVALITVYGVLLVDEYHFPALLLHSQRWLLLLLIHCRMKKTTPTIMMLLLTATTVTRRGDYIRFIQLIIIGHRNQGQISTMIHHLTLRKFSRTLHRAQEQGAKEPQDEGPA